MSDRLRLLASRFLLFLAFPVCGCGNFGPERLNEDQLGFSHALGEGQKRQTFQNIIQIRYGDTPVFLNISQVISGYQLQRNVTAGFELFPTSSSGTYLSGSGGVQLQQTPTFTFQPVTGQEFTSSFIRPLSPTELIPLSVSGLPIDVLFRLSVQSINGLQNSTALDTLGRGETREFPELLIDLRKLQVAGLLDIRLTEHVQGAANPSSRTSQHLLLSLADSIDPDLEGVVTRARHLLGIRPNEKEVEIVYGRQSQPGQIAVLTRPILGVLAQVGSEIEVPAEDIRRGRTFSTQPFAPILRRPAVVIHSDVSRPASSFCEIQYRDRWYWIADDDFDSKVAFTILELLLALSQTAATPGTVVTIPAR